MVVASPSPLLKFDAERVQFIRARLEMTQQEFADHLRVSVATVRSWEQGETKPYRGVSKGKLLAAEELARRRFEKQMMEEDS